ncbi:unnamed protein product [Medioppia subpectinata]|uniref:Cytochrome P450 n=1 Tax=Medioppia subpectinata TaxID=1979941 RepID=A0A7R9PUZ0_9ACAR|nr:unnamed protein product [Medioppia subpectinata]CAG2102089.1 unnamed protein product [Medioppia subpectinata]
MRKKLPPGPIGLPFVGYLPFLKGETSKKLVELGKKYGPVYGIQLGLYPAVVLNDWASIKEALSDDTALYRPKDNFFNSATPRGLTSLSGDVWREHKRFALYELRNLGFGKTAMEDHIIDEINHLSQLLDEKEGQEIDFRNVFPVGVSNNVNFLLFGRRFEYTDSRAKAITEFSKLDPKYDVAGYFAFYPRVTRFAIKHLTFLIPPSLRHINNIFKGMKEIIKSEYETHVKTIDENNNRDYVDAFINETRKNSDRKTFDYNLLEGNILNLFGAGTGTLLQTLEWALLVLAAKPEIQQKLHKEIDEDNHSD